VQAHRLGDPFAPTEETLTLYAAALARQNLKKPTIEQHLSAIRSTLVDHGIAAPTETGRLRRVLRGVPRNPLAVPLKPPKLPRLPITADVLAGMRPYIDHQSWSGALLWFACLLGSVGLLRAGEFAVDSDLPEDERQRRMLRLRHLTMSADATSMTLHIPVTKTSQVNGSNVVYARAADATLCPLAAWRAYATVRMSQPHKAQRDANAPLLLTERGAALLKKDLVAQMRLVLRAAGIEDESTLQRFSGHSFRRGGAQTLHEGGMSVAQIQSAGRWRSNVVQLYFSDARAVASAVAPMFAVAATKVAPAAATQPVMRDGAASMADHLPPASTADLEAEPPALPMSVRPTFGARRATVDGGGLVYFQLHSAAEAEWGVE
jgi:hypothetical protein